MFFEDVDFLVNGSIPNYNSFNHTNNGLVDCKMGYLRGNMFKNEYIPYKNYNVKELIPKTEEEALMLKLNEAEFALNDISLYLDLHPNDDDMYNIFREEVKKYKSYLEQYEKMYRPLNLTSTYSDAYDYYKNPWPWDNDGGVKYV
ncbi:MAG: spore coat protein CotJB [bacterium]|nr:spore coat protein CotJB [bacterium]